MSSEFRLVYMTAGSMEEARRIGDTLVAERLAACCNLVPSVRSIYRWQGEVQRETEIVVIAKTSEGRVPALTERVRALHSYDCPCVVSLPIESGNPDFLSWISDQVK